jgi:flagellar capping protein FliD
VQVVIGNDNSGVESTVNQFVSDYNSLISAINSPGREHQLRHAGAALRVADARAAAAAADE